MTARAAPAEVRPVDMFLLLAALLVWVFSMCLPVFSGGGDSPPLPGGGILLLGMLFGWYANGWAVYANCFFLYAAFRLCTGKLPRWSILLMLAFAATLPLVNPRQGTPGARDMLAVSWGWGAFMWLWSLVLLTAATVARRRMIGAPLALGLGVLMLASGLAASALHERQWRAADHEDRSVFLPAGMIYTTSELCTVPLTWPMPSGVPGGEPVVLDIDAQLLASPGAGPWLTLPGGFTQAQADGSAWVMHAMWDGYFMVRQPPAPGMLRLQVNAVGRDAVIRLLKGEPQRLLYEQPLKNVDGARGHRFCPLMVRAPQYGLRSDYQQALLNAMGQVRSLAYGLPLARAEVAIERCPTGSVDIDGIAGLRSLDGRDVLLGGTMTGMSGFCSASYIALSGTRTVPGDGRLLAVVYVVDRKTLAPLAMFDGVGTCPPTVCAADLKVTVKAIRLEGRRAIVDTSHGAFVAGLIRL